MAAEKTPRVFVFRHRTVEFHAKRPPEAGARDTIAKPKHKRNRNTSKPKEGEGFCVMSQMISWLAVATVQFSKKKKTQE